MAANTADDRLRQEAGLAHGNDLGIWARSGVPVLPVGHSQSGYRAQRPLLRKMPEGGAKDDEARITLVSRRSAEGRMPSSTHFASAVAALRPISRTGK